jgi:TRAP-type mannitol/chloroaromatic compound transport system permease small subunit
MVWVLETSIILCTRSFSLAGGYALREKAHICVNIVATRFSLRNQILLRLMGFVFAIIYCFVFTWMAAKLAIYSLQSGEVSPTPLRIPTVIPLSFMPVGGPLLILEFLRQIVKDISDLKNTAKEEKRAGPWLIRNPPPLVFLAFVVFSSFIMLSRELAPLGIIILLFVLIFSGMPIAFGLGLLGLMGLYFTLAGGPILAQLPLVAYNFFDNFVVIAIPQFITFTVILSAGGIGVGLFDFASKWVRLLPGGWQ